MTLKCSTFCRVVKSDERFDLDWILSNPNSVTLKRCDRRSSKDHRGEFLDLGVPILDASPIETKSSVSKTYVVRGMHQQPGKNQIKELMVISGRITDLVYDQENQILYVVKMKEGDRILIGGNLYHGFYTKNNHANVIYNIFGNGWNSSYEHSLPVPMNQSGESYRIVKDRHDPRQTWGTFSPGDLHCDKVKISQKDSVGELPIKDVVHLK